MVTPSVASSRRPDPGEENGGMMGFLDLAALSAGLEASHRNSVRSVIPCLKLRSP
jgi:hypothetical protein